MFNEKIIKEFTGQFFLFNEYCMASYLNWSIKDTKRVVPMTELKKVFKVSQRTISRSIIRLMELDLVDREFKFKGELTGFLPEEELERMGAGSQQVITLTPKFKEIFRGE